jgi:serine/threonine-protein kinase
VHRGGIVIFLFGMALTLTLFLMLQRRARELRRAEFERRANQVAASFRASLELPLEVLHSIESLFDASVEVTRDEFRDFVSSALKRHPGIRALEWIPLVNRVERDTFVKRAREDGLKDFDFKQVAQDLTLVRAEARDEYLPIYYMEPPDPFALGFDVASDAVRRLPTDRARALDRAVVSERIRLVEDPPSIASIAVFLPVHAKPGRKGRVLGFATVVFRVHQVLTPAIKEAVSREIQVVLSDPTASTESQLLFESSPGSSGAEHSKTELVSHFPYVDRTWKLSFSSTHGDGPMARAPWVLLGLGAALSVLLALAHSALKIIQALRREVRDALRLGQYNLIEKLGEGGMGVVYRGSHALLRRPTAIKLLPPTRRNAHQLARFEREVQMTSRLAHPNTISIYDYGRTPEGIFYYAMEYLDGLTLEELVAYEGPLPAGRALRVLQQIVSALIEAHGLGLIHRDIKPANIMLTRRGTIPDFVKVLDFGLVKESDDGTKDSASLSRVMPIFGTPLYMSPEAALSKELDARADLYAVGAVAYYLVCGKPVFDGLSVVEVCLQHINSPPIPPSQRSANPVPAGLEAAILQCLQKEPEARPQSASELLAKLREIEPSVPAYGDTQANAFWDERWPILAERITKEKRKAVDSGPGATIAVSTGQRESPTQAAAAST